MRRPDARIEAAVAEVVRRIDARLEQYRDAAVLAMIADGVEQDDVEACLRCQLQLEAEWRAQALPALRAEIAAWLSDPKPGASAR